QMERSLANPEKSPPKKKKAACEPSGVESAHAFEDIAAGMTSRMSSLTFFCLPLCFSERAAADTCQMRELETLLKEARNLESFLKEKKSHLRQTLALISDKLQG
uniref:Uncharacterized protein n=1 Tax=Salarias fasciatus TaxID=181472 RepID=A0A672JDP0_SALFA